MVADQEGRIVKQIKTKSIWSKISFVVCSILIALFLSLFVFIYTHEYYPVTGQSMYPTINGNGVNENGVYVNPYFMGEYQDIVVAKTDDGTTVIKRLLGLEGDKIGFIEEANGEVHFYRIPSGTIQSEYENNLASFKVEEDYVEDIYGNRTQKSHFDSMLLDRQENKVFIYDRVSNTFHEFYEVPKGEVFLMGDNRGHTTDSSTYGSISIDNIIGKVDYMVKNNYLQVFEILFKIITFRGSNI